MIPEVWAESRSPRRICQLRRHYLEQKVIRQSRVEGDLADLIDLLALLFVREIHEAADAAERFE